jgi:hypothetical protein
MLTGANENFTAIGIMNATGVGSAPGQPPQCWSMNDNPANSLISVGLGGGGSNNNLRMICRSNNGQLININGGNFVGTGWQIVAIGFDWGTKTGKLILNGATNTGTNALMDVWAFATPTAVLHVGANYVPNPYYNWDGYYGEFVWYSGILSNAQINLLGNYLAGKYALSWTAI